MQNLTLDLDLGDIATDDITFLQEEGSSAMPEFAASCCEDCSYYCCGSCSSGGGQEIEPEAQQ